MARGEVGLASRLHRSRFSAKTPVERMRQDMADQVRELRRLRSRGVAVRFDPRTFDPEVNGLVRIGQGSMGGKARGLVFMSRCLVDAADTLPVEVHIPKTCMVTTDWFENFVRDNALRLPSDEETDESIARRFQAADLPDSLVSQLAAWIAHIPGPLSVRSSSMLEDAPGPTLCRALCHGHAAPEPDPVRRLQALVRAVRPCTPPLGLTKPGAFARGRAVNGGQPPMGSDGWQELGPARPWAEGQYPGLWHCGPGRQRSYPISTPKGAPWQKRVNSAANYIGRRGQVWGPKRWWCERGNTRRPADIN